MKSEQSSMLSQVIVETAEQLINEVYPNIVEKLYQFRMVTRASYSINEDQYCQRPLPLVL